MNDGKNSLAVSKAMKAPFRSSFKGETRDHPLSLLILIVLLFLRIPFYTGMALIIGKSLDRVEQVFDIGTFLLTAVFIWLERERWRDFHITPLAVWLVLLGKPLMPLLIFVMGGAALSPLSFPRPASFSYVLISVGLVVALKLSGWSWGTVSSSEWRWLGWGLMAGLGSVILWSYPMAFNLRDTHSFMFVSMSSFYIALIRIPQQLGYAAITEEPLFRGFLWGMLRKYGWKDGWILICQTLLFMLGHLFYLPDMPYMFWLVIPLSALFLGMLAWRSRTLVSSMAGHAMINAFGVLVGQIVGKWIF